MSDQTLLKVTDLQRHFPFREVQGLRMVRATVKAVDGISFSIKRGPDARPRRGVRAAASRRRRGS